MKLRKQRPAPAPPAQPATTGKPPWQDLLDPQERPNREDLAAHGNVFDHMIEPVPMPRWLRRRRREPRDRVS